MATLGNTPRPGYVYDTETDTWVPIGVGAHTHSYIPNTLVDAKGDILTATADDTPARLAKGADGTVLVSDSTTSTGLAWQPYGNQLAAGKNGLINGGFDFWQRGASFSTNYAYTADRWVAGADAGTFSATQSTDVPTGFRYSLSMAGTNTTSAQIYQIIESFNSAQFAGQTVTLSIYAKSTIGSSGLAWVTQVPGATDNWSSASTDQTGTFSATPSGSWTRYSATFTVSANATKGYKIIIYRSVSTTSTTTIYTGAQLELGSVATPFARTGGTIQGELAACKYYFKRMSVTNGQFGYAQGMNQNTTTSSVIFNGTMRTTPTSTINGTLRLIQGNSDFAITSINATYYSSLNDSVAVQFVTTGLTAGSTTQLYASTSGVSFDLSAEL